MGDHHNIPRFVVCIIESKNLLTMHTRLWSPSASITYYKKGLTGYASVIHQLKPMDQIGLNFNARFCRPH